MHLCFVNASNLTRDAEGLLTESPDRAISLSILAWEEIGKIYLLCTAAAKAPIEWQEIKKELRLMSHIHKQEVFAGYGKDFLNSLLTSIGKEPDEEIPSRLAPLLNKLKQLGFYVDCFQGEFISPVDFGRDNSGWAIWLLEKAKERLESIRMMHHSEKSSINVARVAAIAAKRLKEKSSEIESAEEVYNVIGEILSMKKQNNST